MNFMHCVNVCQCNNIINLRCVSLKIPTPVAEQLLAPGQLDESMLQQCLHDLAGARIDYADIYLQSSSHEAWVLEDSIVKSGSFSIESGLGIRAISGEKTGFAYADSIDPAALTRAAQAAKGI